MKLVKNVINGPVTRSQQTEKTGKTSDNQLMADDGLAMLCWSWLCAGNVSLLPVACVSKDGD
jgi:hypothetical protein